MGEIPTGFAGEVFHGVAELAIATVGFQNQLLLASFASAGG